MKTRIISALIMLPMLIFVYLGGLPFFLVCLIIAAIGMHEFYKGYENIGVHANKILGYISLVGLYSIIFIGENIGFHDDVYAHILLLWIFLNIAASVATALFKKDNNILDGPITSLGVFYVGFFSAHMVLLSGIQRYQLIIWMVFLTAFGTDIAAYFTGYCIGNKKLCPSLSPKKTVEGAIGGIVGSIFGCCVFGYIVYPQLMIHWVIIGFLGSIVAQIGDLSASAFKRKMGIKDYGNLIPGHGGVLDRFDSVFFTAPFIYYYVIVFIKP